MFLYNLATSLVSLMICLGDEDLTDGSSPVYGLFWDMECRTRPKLTNSSLAYGVRVWRVADGEPVVFLWGYRL